MIITLKDGSTKEYSQPMSVIDIAKDISEGLARAACVAEVNGETVDLRTVIDSVSAVRAADFRMVFDPTIVRGMGYYTGTIFEIAMPELGISCGGGGRYDKMVGKFTGRDVPACGFSIGFERIILILMEQGFKIPGRPQKTAFLIEKNLPAERLQEVMVRAQEARAEGKQVLIARMAKNKKFQKQQLKDRGYEDFEEFYKNPIAK